MKKVIVIKKLNEIGSLVLDIDNLEKLNSLFDYLVEESFNTDIEVISVKGIENYQEYYPITVINDSKEFTIKVLEMMEYGKSDISVEKANEFILKNYNIYKELGDM